MIAEDTQSYRDENVFLAIRNHLMLCCALLICLAIIGGGVLPLFAAFFIINSLIISSWRVYRSKDDLRLRRQIKNDRSFEHSIVEMDLILENRSQASFIFSQLEDVFPPTGAGIHVQLTPMNVPVLSERSYRIRVKYPCRNRRGKYCIGPLRFRVFDMFGFFSTFKSDLSFYDFFIYSRPVDLRSFVYATRSTPFSIGALTARRARTGRDIINLREYRREDDPRFIHWAATARMNQLILKEFEEENASRITVFFDLSKNSLAGLGHHTTTEYAVRIVASIAKAAIDEGHHLQVIANGETELRHEFGTGLVHLYPLWQHLATARAKGDLPLMELLELNLPFIPENSCVIIVFSKCDSESPIFMRVLETLKSKRVEVNLVLIDHTSFLALDKVHDHVSYQNIRSELLKYDFNIFQVKKRGDLACDLLIPDVGGQNE